MGEHSTWIDYLPAWRHLEENLAGVLDRKAATELFPTHFTLNHVLFAALVLLFVAWGSYRFYSAVTRSADGIVPPRSFNLRNLFELIAESVYGLTVQVMGEKNGKRFFPFIGSLALFILLSNLLALIPGMGVPTTTLKTNLALSLTVFVVYNYVGIRENGLGRYLAHFMGPIPLLAPLMLPIELISHLARPLSLAIRLLGNMAADHKVVFTFAMLAPLVIPIPFLFLGLLVAVVQTLVFCLLTMVYISMAVAHEADH
jgi:F-type H+-transporting ATPase subunit a